MSTKITTEYKRDMYHNYLVIHDDAKVSSDYYEQVRKYNSIFGLLGFESRMFDKKKYAYYEISGLQTLSCIFEKLTLQAEELSQIITDIIQTVSAGKEFLLKETDYILSPDMVFLELPKYQVKLCYFPGYEISLRMQLHDLFEYFMNKVDYRDQEAVLLIYSLYMQSKEEGCTIDQLLSILHNRKMESQSTITENQETMNEHKLDVQGMREVSFFETSDKNTQPITNKNTQTMINKISQSIINKNSPHKKESEEKALENENKVSAIKGNLTSGVQSVIGKVSNKMPFISERTEGEKEVLYYPFSCYVMVAGSILIAACIFWFAYKEEVIFYPVKQSIDPVKCVILLAILIIIVIYISTKLFDKKYMVSRIVPNIEYSQPTHSDISSNYQPMLMNAKKVVLNSNVKLQESKVQAGKIQSSNKQGNNMYEDNKLEDYDHQYNNYENNKFENDRQDNDFPGNRLKENRLQENIFQKNKFLENKTQDSNQTIRESIKPIYEDSRALQIETEDNEEEGKTVLITNYFAKQQAKLCPTDKVNYETIILSEFPFFIGKLKTHIDYKISAPTISRFHAKIIKENEEFYIVDLNSTNGTFVNGVQLNGEVKIKIVAGDEVTFANVTYLFSS